MKKLMKHCLTIFSIFAVSATFATPAKVLENGLYCNKDNKNHVEMTVINHQLTKCQFFWAGRSQPCNLTQENDPISYKIDQGDNDFYILISAKHQERAYELMLFGQYSPSNQAFTIAEQYNNPFSQTENLVGTYHLEDGGGCW